VITLALRSFTGLFLLRQDVLNIGRNALQQFFGEHRLLVVLFFEGEEVEGSMHDLEIRIRFFNVVIIRAHGFAAVGPVVVACDCFYAINDASSCAWSSTQGCPWYERLRGDVLSHNKGVCALDGDIIVLLVN
jgi:hypothetical protein